MKRLVLAVLAATLSLAMFVAPAAAFPDQGQPHSCGVLTTLPKDVIGQIADHAPEAAARLEAQFIDACS